MLITSKYRKMNRKLHDSLAHYGAGGWSWIGPIQHFMDKYNARTLLDYGCGKGTLSKWFSRRYPAKVFNYDPVTFPDDPPGCDFVVCLDVLEHIEPDCLDDVLAHLRLKCLNAGLLVISTREAAKTLEDGRNAHLIVEDEDWWAEKLSGYFARVIRFSQAAPELQKKGEASFLVEV